MRRVRVQNSDYMEPSSTHEGRKWFVLTTFDPKHSEEILRSHSGRCDANGEPLFSYFVPYTYLTQRKTHELPGDATEEDVHDDEAQQSASEDSEGEAEIVNKRNRAAVKENNETRAALRRYIFVNAEERWLVSFLGESWNRESRFRIAFLSPREKKHAFVSDKSMDAFIEALSDLRLNFELSPAIEDLQKGDRIRFKNHAFEGQDVYVVDYRRTSKGITMTVAVDLITKRLRVKVLNIREEDIYHVDDAHTKYANNNALIKRNQQQLMAIISRRVNRKQTAESDLADVATLNDIFTTRFRHFDDYEVAARRRFMAQMLLCACMLNDSKGKVVYTKNVLSELEKINSVSESKAATDVRARLHVALFIATGNPEFRRMAKDYVKTHDPKSARLRSLIRMISKHNARYNIQWSVLHRTQE